MQQPSLSSQREALINAAIPFVVTHGWNEQALSETCTLLGEAPAYWKMFFADISDLVEFFERSEDMRAISAMKSSSKIEGIRNKIGKALFERIVNISGGTPMLKRLEEFYLKNPASAARNIWHSADTIWIFAGDKSTDFNYYTKRTLLSGVYVSIVRHVLSSNAHDIPEIQSYISDALDKVVKFGSFKKLLKIPKMEDIPILRMFS